MGTDTTRVSGSAEVPRCLRKAAYVMYDVYDYPASKIHPDVKPHADSIWETWKSPEIIDDPGSGFHARYYEPKSEPGTPGYCPPVLAFRGSETNDSDFADLGVIIDFNLTHDIFWLPNLDMTLPIAMDSAKKEMKSEAREAAIRSIGNNLELSRVTGTTTFSYTRNKIWGEGRTDPTLVNVTYDIRVTIYYDQNGDWGTNVTQGMGGKTKQYDLAMKHGVAKAQIAIDKWQSQLLIIGHSLGGGLAAAAAAAAKKEHAECDIRANTYNAAGVHPDTLSRAYKATVDQNPTRNFSVMDEILTTLQIHSKKMPLLDSILRWGRDNTGLARLGFPPAIRKGLQTTHRGISPGYGGLNGHVYAPAYSQLPVLWPINKNELADGQVRLSADAPDSAQQLAQNAADRQRIVDAIAREEARWWSDKDKIEALKQQLAAFDESHQQAPDLANVGNFPTITRIDVFSKGVNATEFVQGVLNYVITGNLAPTTNQPLHVDKANFNAASARVTQVKNEGMGIAPIAGAAVDYHLYDSCTFTFLDPRNPPA